MFHINIQVITFVTVGLGPCINLKHSFQESVSSCWKEVGWGTGGNRVMQGVWDMPWPWKPRVVNGDWRHRWIRTEIDSCCKVVTESLQILGYQGLALASLLVFFLITALLSPSGRQICTDAINQADVPLASWWVWPVRISNRTVNSGRRGKWVYQFPWLTSSQASCVGCGLYQMPLLLPWWLSLHSLYHSGVSQTPSLCPPVPRGSSSTDAPDLGYSFCIEKRYVLGMLKVVLCIIKCLAWPLHSPATLMPSDLATKDVYKTSATSPWGTD